MTQHIPENDDDPLGPWIDSHRKAEEQPVYYPKVQWRQKLAFAVIALVLAAALLGTWLRAEAWVV